MTQQTIQPQDELTCKKCGSNQVYTRISSNQLVCRRCGGVENKKTEVKQ